MHASNAMSPVRAESPDRSRWNNKAYNLRCAPPHKSLRISILRKPGRIAPTHLTFRVRSISFVKMSAEKREKLEGKLMCSTPFSSRIQLIKDVSSPD